MKISYPKSTPFRMAMMALCLGLGLHAAGCGPFSSGRNVPAETPETQSEAPETGDGMAEPYGGLSEPYETDPVATPSAPALEPIQGYRVQLYSLTSRERAEAALDQVKQTLAEWSYGVYLQEESGSFKIRVGDFEDKADADILRDWFRNKGFVDAWTAGTLIHAP